MKPKSMLILVTALLLTLILTMKFLWPSIYSKVESSSGSREVYFYLHEDKAFSTSVYESDYLRNSILLTHLVGTLVKEDNTGKFVPYLAKEVLTSKDKKLWRFNISEGLSCEGGEAITAESYAQNLTLSLKRYKKSGGILEFEKLKGASRLKVLDKSPIDGIRSDGNWLILEFDSPPEQLLERLTDQYFGYFCHGNFKEDNYTWKNENEIISSGPFRLESVRSPNHFVLDLRDDFPLAQESQVQKGHFISIQELSELGEQVDILQVKNILPRRDDLTVVEGRPTFTVNLSIEVGETNFFRDRALRTQFFDSIYFAKNKKPYSSVGTLPTNSIFPTLQEDYFGPNIENRQFIGPTNIKVAKNSKVVLAMSSSITGNDRSYLIDLVEGAAAEFGLKVDLYSPEKYGKDNLNTDRPWDLRITSVDLSSLPYFSHLDMIFCSKLGARYPDPSSRMCEFVKKNLPNASGPLSDSEINYFHRLLVEDASLLPISHRSLTYLYGEKIDIRSLSGSALWPRIDLLNFLN